MARKPPNDGKKLTPGQVETLRRMAPTRPAGIIGYTLGRSKAAIYSKAYEEEISLAPPERSPYGLAAE